MCHNSVLLFLARSFSYLQNCMLFADLSFFSYLALINGDSLRSDLALISPDKTLYPLELTILCETNIESNSNRKAAKYKDFVRDFDLHYRSTNFINLPMRIF